MYALGWHSQRSQSAFCTCSSRHAANAERELIIFMRDWTLHFPSIKRWYARRSKDAAARLARLRIAWRCNLEHIRWERVHYIHTWLSSKADSGNETVIQYLFHSLCCVWNTERATLVFCAARTSNKKYYKNDQLWWAGGVNLVRKIMS